MPEKPPKKFHEITQSSKKLLKSVQGLIPNVLRSHSESFIKLHRQSQEPTRNMQVVGQKALKNHYQKIPGKKSKSSKKLHNSFQKST